MIYVWIALGSAIGGVARYACSGLAARLIGETFPFGTLIVNVAGSFVIGFVATLSDPDGRYFIDLDDGVAEPLPTELVLVQHFADELKRLVPHER